MQAERTRTPSLPLHRGGGQVLGGSGGAERSVAAPPGGPAEPATRRARPPRAVTRVSELRSEWARPSAADLEGTPAARGRRGREPAGVSEAPAADRRVARTPSSRDSGRRMRAPRCRPAWVSRRRPRSPPTPGRGGGAAATPPSRVGPSLC